MRRHVDRVMEDGTVHQMTESIPFISDEACRAYAQAYAQYQARLHAKALAGNVPVSPLVMTIRAWMWNGKCEVWVPRGMAVLAAAGIHVPTGRIRTYRFDTLSAHRIRSRTQDPWSRARRKQQGARRNGHGA